MDMLTVAWLIRDEKLKRYRDRYFDLTLFTQGLIY